MNTRRWMGLALLCLTGAAQAAPNPTALVKKAFDNWRGNSSYTDMTMTIHRPDWQRSLSMRTWTRGKDDALVRFTAPSKDAGNATLKLGSAMWLFNPKLNQIIKLPASMLAQSWMDSDFSYNDLAKADSVLKDYSHTLTGTARHDGHTVYTIKAVPKADAPVVWGKQVLKIRDDGVLLEETFFDQDMKPVKDLVTKKVGPVGGRPYPRIMKMTVAAKPGHWTRIEVAKGRFNLSLPGYLFTQSNLRNPRPWHLQ